MTTKVGFTTRKVGVGPCKHTKVPKTKTLYECVQCGYNTTKKKLVVCPKCGNTEEESKDGRDS